MYLPTGSSSAQLALLLQKQNRRRRELLGNRSDGVAHLRRGRNGRGRCRSHARTAVGVGVDELAMLHHCDRGRRHARGFEHLRGDAVHLAAQRGIDGVDGLGGAWLAAAASNNEKIAGRTYE